MAKNKVNILLEVPLGKPNQAEAQCRYKLAQNFASCLDPLTAEVQVVWTDRANKNESHNDSQRSLGSLREVWWHTCLDGNGEG